MILNLGEIVILASNLAYFAKHEEEEEIENPEPQFSHLETGHTKTTYYIQFTFNNLSYNPLTHENESLTYCHRYSGKEKRDESFVKIMEFLRGKEK